MNDLDLRRRFFAEELDRVGTQQPHLFAEAGGAERVVIQLHVIGKFEQRRQNDLRICVHRDGSLREFQQIHGSFQTAAALQKSPAVTSRHIFHFHSAERGEVSDKRVN